MGTESRFGIRVVSLFLLLSVGAKAQEHLDPPQVDPQHFKVEYEDARIHPRGMLQKEDARQMTARLQREHAFGQEEHQAHDTGKAQAA